MLKPRAQLGQALTRGLSSSGFAPTCYAHRFSHQARWASVVVGCSAPAGL